ncbi:unnamed protein product, partial [Amoebophrya sp. A25]
GVVDSFFPLGGPKERGVTAGVEHQLKYSCTERNEEEDVGGEEGEVVKDEKRPDHAPLRLSSEVDEVHKGHGHDKIRAAACLDVNSSCSTGHLQEHQHQQPDLRTLLQSVLDASATKCAALEDKIAFLTKQVQELAQPQPGLAQRTNPGLLAHQTGSCSLDHLITRKVSETLDKSDRLTPVVKKIISHQQ